MGGLACSETSILLIADECTSYWLAMMSYIREYIVLLGLTLC